MTPLEKAKETVGKYDKLLCYNNTKMTVFKSYSYSKKCALISVKDTIKALHVDSDMQNFYIEVQRELEKL